MPDGELQWDGGREATAFGTGPRTTSGKSRKAGRRDGGSLLSRRVTSTEGSPAMLSATELEPLMGRF